MSKTGKRQRRGTNIEEVTKPRGFDRGLALEKILGAANLGKTPLTLHYLVRWMGCDELDLIPAPEMNEHAPEEVIAYYESISRIHRTFEQKEKERLALALRPVIVSKVEKMMHTESTQNDEYAAPEEIPQPPLFPDSGHETTAEQPQDEQSAAMVQIPQEYQSDLPMLDQTAAVEMNWTAEEQMLPQ